MSYIVGALGDLLDLCVPADINHLDESGLPTTSSPRPSDNLKIYHETDCKETNILTRSFDIALHAMTRENEMWVRNGCYVAGTLCLNCAHIPLSVENDKMSCRTMVTSSSGAPWPKRKENVRIAREYHAQLVLLIVPLVRARSQLSMPSEDQRGWQLDLK